MISHAPAPTTRARGPKERLIVVSNRVASPTGPHAGGLGQAMRSALSKVGGIWFGWSGKVSDEPLLHVRREGPMRCMTRDLDPTDYRDYYLGFSNRVLWPLLHGRLDLVAYRREALQGYLRVNAVFADSIQRIVRPTDMIWVHDYHLIPLARMLRERGVTCRIGFFLHVPVPPPQTLAALPGHDDLLHAFSACDLVGVQTAEDAANLRDYFMREKARAPGSVAVPKIGAFPIGIDADAIGASARDATETPAVKRLAESLCDRALMLGVDRLDYSKGLPQRLRSYGRLLRDHAELRERVTFLQIAPPTRCAVPEYGRINRELQRLAGFINGRHADAAWTPIRYLNRSFAQSDLTGFYRLAKVGVVTPLRDGMNLVAKEYVAAQDGNDPGVLVLSEFAGAARELDGALMINPFDIDQCAQAMHRALVMPLAERRERWLAMMDVLRRNDIHGWRDDFLAALATTRGAVKTAERGREGHDEKVTYGPIRWRTPTPSTALTVTPQSAPAT